MRKPYGTKTDIEDLKDTCWMIASIINRARADVTRKEILNIQAELFKDLLDEYGSYEDWSREYTRLYRKAKRYNLDLSKIWANSKDVK